MVDNFVQNLYSAKDFQTTSKWVVGTGILVGGTAGYRECGIYLVHIYAYIHTVFPCTGVAGAGGVGGLVAGLVSTAVGSAFLGPAGWATSAALFIAGGALAAWCGYAMKKMTEISDKNIRDVARRVKSSMLFSQTKGDVQNVCLLDEIVSHCDKTCEEVIDTLAEQFKDMVEDHNQHIRMRVKIKDIGDLDKNLRLHIKKLNEMRVEANDLFAPRNLKLANPWFTTTVKRPFELCELFNKLSYQKEEMYQFTTIFGEQFFLPTLPTRICVCVCVGVRVCVSLRSFMT